MTGIWGVFLMLVTLICWSPPPAAAAKVEQFKDDQGKLHITNVAPEEPAPAKGSPAAAPLKPKVFQAQPPEVTESVAEAPEMPGPAQGQPEAPPPAAAPPEGEGQPNNG